MAASSSLGLSTQDRPAMPPRPSSLGLGSQNSPLVIFPDKVEKKVPNLVGPQTMVTVSTEYQGRTSKPFLVHKNFICYYSPFFNAAFNGSFIEGETQKLDLEDTRPDVFGIFVNWLYTQTVVDADGELPTCSALLNLWMFADRVLSPKLQNQTIECLEKVRIKVGRLSSAEFNRVWENTSKDSQLRRYITTVSSENMLAKITHPDRYPHELLADIINNMREETRKRMSPRLVLSTEQIRGFYVNYVNEEELPGRQ